jgi:endonuclease G
MTAPTKRLASLLGLLLVAGCAPLPSLPVAKREADRNILFGMPAPAKEDPAEREAYLFKRPQYTLSYNAKRLTPNWVCWQLRKDNIGHAQRGPFESDPDLPKGFPEVTTHVYDGSGFDRGHMCPAQDRSSSQKDMDATFYTTNIVPQSPNCNQRGWERLEAYCRELTKDGHVLQIACGPDGVGGAGKEGHKEKIGKGKLAVTVPAKVWKVILVLPNEEAEPTAETRAIAVIMPNDQSVDYDWTKYRVSVRDVEKLTDFTFFPNVPAETAAAIKDRVDDVEVRVSRPKDRGN